VICRFPQVRGAFRCDAWPEQLWEDMKLGTTVSGIHGTEGQEHRRELEELGFIYRKTEIMALWLGHSVAMPLPAKRSRVICWFPSGLVVLSDAWPEQL
jgi:hypothetical protein